VKGFFGTWASFSADLNLLAQIAMGIALLAGTFLARAKRYAAHGACQAVVLVLNLPMIALVMWPSLHVRVLPQLSRHFEKRYYAVATVHGVLGTLAEALGLYIVLAAGTNIWPSGGWSCSQGSGPITSGTPRRARIENICSRLTAISE
jgi:uncharacterized membrane protein YozB (DUF420 family)